LCYDAPRRVGTRSELVEAKYDPKPCANLSLRGFLDLQRQYSLGRSEEGEQSRAPSRPKILRHRLLLGTGDLLRLCGQNGCQDSSGGRSPCDGGADYPADDSWRCSLWLV